MSQKQRLKELIIDFCNESGSRTFSLQELHLRYENYEKIGIIGKTPHNTVRRLLQELREEEVLSFQGMGHYKLTEYYTLRSVEFLASEVEDFKHLDISKEQPEKREYLMETYARTSRWSILAKEKFGRYCLIPDCSNTFLKPDNQPYIEVHHIIPLCQGGDDGIWNLSVLCAHHHRMAHFAREEIKIDIQNKLLNKVKTLLDWGIYF